VVKRFVRAALRGWQYTLANREESAKIQMEQVKALNPEIVMEEINILKRIAITTEVEKSGFGTVTLGRMRRTVDFINKNIDVPGEKLTAEQIYRPGFLPTEPILPK
jgi:NitT/TauT family transport system substrate-binding protein